MESVRQGQQPPPFPKSREEITVVQRVQMKIAADVRRGNGTHNAIAIAECAGEE
jgi:hypothetical protein